MSDKVIRFGGSNVNNAKSIQNLVSYLGQFDSRKFIVVSAIPEILELIEKNIKQVFETDSSVAAERFRSIYTEITGLSPSENYLKLVEQYSNIL